MQENLFINVEQRYNKELIDELRKLNFDIRRDIIYDKYLGVDGDFEELDYQWDNRL